MDPNKLTVIDNADKKWHSKWSKDRNLGNIPHPFRAVMIGRPGCGKTSVAQNLLIRQKPAFEELIIVHVDKEYSAEWDNCDPTQIIDHVPDFKQIAGDKKTLIVFEDFEITGLDKESRRLLSRLFGYCSTHKNCSLIVCQQDFSAVTPIVRRLSNLFVLWKGIDMRSMDQYGRTIGMVKGELVQYFREYCKTAHDSIWLDLTSGTPAPVRLNCYTIIKRA